MLQVFDTRKVTFYSTYKGKIANTGLYGTLGTQVRLAHARFS